MPTSPLGYNALRRFPICRIRNILLRADVGIGPYRGGGHSLKKILRNS